MVVLKQSWRTRSFGAGREDVQAGVQVGQTRTRFELRLRCYYTDYYTDENSEPGQLRSRSFMYEKAISAVIRGGSMGSCLMRTEQLGVFRKPLTAAVSWGDFNEKSRNQPTSLPFTLKLPADSTFSCLAILAETLHISGCLCLNQRWKLMCVLVWKQTFEKLRWTG